MPLPLDAAWFNKQKAAGQLCTSPLTNLALSSKVLVPNQALRSVVQSLEAAGVLG